MTDKTTVHRRTILLPLAFGATAVGIGFALWPFVAALNAPADIRAQRVVFDLTTLRENAPALIEVRRSAVVIFRRTPEELAALRSQPQLGERALKNSREPAEARNWHRSLRPEIAVFSAVCTHGDCVVSRLSSSDAELLCPCCGAHYDLAGHVLNGPAPRNLNVPPHEYIGDTMIEFPEYMPPT